MSARLVSDLKRLHNSRREEWGDEKSCPLLKKMSWYLPQILLSFSEDNTITSPVRGVTAGDIRSRNASLCKWSSEVHVSTVRQTQHHTDHGEEEASLKAQAIFVSHFGIC